MKRNTLNYLIVTALLAPSASHASTHQVTDGVNLDFGMDAYVRSHAIKPSESSTENGFTSRVRVKANLLLDDGWSINTRWQAYYNWAGDRRHSGGEGSNFTDGVNNDGISLDLGFVQYSQNNLLLRAGRQRADWAYGFNIDNDRRDRLLAMKTYSLNDGDHFSLLGIYDLRFSESEYVTPSHPKDFYDDVHMYALAAVGNYNRWDWGMLWAYFDGGANNIGTPDINAPQAGYGIDYFHNISPYFTGTFGDFALKGAMNIILSDSTEKNSYHTTWGSNGYAGFIEGSYQLTSSVKLQAQGLGFIDGGLLGRGFDTYSGLINNSDRNNPSPISRQFFGGLGHEDNNGQLYATRLDWQASDKWNLKVAAGHMNIDNNLGTSEDIQATFVDLSGQYQWSQYTDFEFRAGWANEDIDDTAVMALINIHFD
ncbi:hypothetical protein L4D77_11725 [Photobacterium frigidiphilum]|uniref:hypothetical protein n=1 Tax=Photobacterium frigidiphilum TaxID=264736 RepID=UPI003D13C92F